MKRMIWIVSVALLAMTATGASAADYVAAGGFETLEPWGPYGGDESAFLADTEIIHGGEQSIRCHNAEDDGKAGARQRVVLDQQTIVPIEISGWSRAEDVSGASDHHYSVYVDFEYVDDTNPGHVDDTIRLPFEVGTHDWQRAHTIFTPARPIKHFTIYALFRQHAGTVWFDDFSVLPLATTRTSGGPEDLTPPPADVVPDELPRAIEQAGPDETVMVVVREKLQPYHRDEPAAFVDGTPVRFEEDTAVWSGALSFDRSALVGAGTPDEPGLHLQPLLGRWSETELALTAVGEQGNAYRVLLALPEGQPLRNVRFDQWEPSFDTAAAHAIGNRVVLVNLMEVMTGADVCHWVLLDQDALREVAIPPRDPESERTLPAGDDLSLSFSEDGALAAVTVAGHERALEAGAATGGWLTGEAGLYVGDLFAGKLMRVRGEPEVDDGRVIVEGAIDELDLAARASFRPRGEGVVVEGEVRDLRGERRAIDVVLKLPVRLNDSALLWHDITTPVPLSESGRFEMKHYPWLAVTEADWGLCLGIDGHYPARESIIYEPESGLLHARIKLGIIQDAKPHLQGRVPFGFMIAPVDPQWGGRDAAAKYYAAWPDLFECRPHREGLWMFGLRKIERVPNPEHFSYSEGPANLPDYVREAGVISAPYIIPNQRALTRLNRLPEDYDEAMELLASEDPEADGWGGRGPRDIIRESAITVADGTYPIRIRDDIGADFKPDPPIYNVVFPVNPDPDLPSGAAEMAQIRELAKMPDVGAIYTDSGSAWSARYLNFREDHFPYADLPLTYDDETGRVAIFGKAPPVEHWHAMGEILHPLDYEVFPNLGHGFEDPWSYFAVDICGCEQGSTTEQFLNYSRTLAYHKPVLYLGYLVLHGRDTFLSEREGLLRHVRRCALMGVMPSIAIRKGYVEFYERDGDIYDLYIPIIKRLSAAGWEPVTHARVAEENVRIERFGPQDGVVYFTLLNEGAQACEATLTIDARALGAGGLGVQSITELLSGRPVEPDGPVLDPGELVVLEVALAD